MTQPNIVLPGPVQTALDLLETAGFEAFVVGGCTRDALLGDAPHDWDITTSALPEETLSVFSDYRTIETGLQHGTVAVLLDDMLLEITTYRVDGTYKDSRHPDAVSFTRSIGEDLARRDFTMNAIAYSPTRGYEDLYGGASDIEAHLIQGEIDGIVELPRDGGAYRILYVAWERISAELLQLLCGRDVYRVLQDYRDVFAVILPELEPCFDFEQHNPWHIYDVFTHIAHSVEYIAPEPALRLAMLLHDIGKPETFFTDEKGIGHFYGHPKRSVEFHDYPVEATETVLLRRLHKFGPETLRHLLLVKRADCLAQNPDKTAEELDKLSTIEHMLDVLLKEGPVFRISDLAVGGGDLIALGMEPGPQIGALLEDVLDRVMAGKLPNDRDAILAEITNKGMTS